MSPALPGFFIHWATGEALDQIHFLKIIVSFRLSRLCCFSLVVRSGGCSLVTVQGCFPLIVVRAGAALWLQCRGLLLSWSTGFLLGHGLSGCCTWALEHSLNSVIRAYGIFLDQALDPCLLHWPVESLPLSRQGRHGSATLYLKSPVQSVSGATQQTCWKDSKKPSGLSWKSTAKD